MIRILGKFAFEIARLLAEKQPTGGPPTTAMVMEHARALLTGIEGDHAGFTLPIPVEWVRIGRSMDNDLSFPNDSGLAPRHAVLFYRDDVWQIMGLPASSGTYVDGERIPPGESVPLSPGAVVAFGGQRLRIQYRIDADEADVICIPTVATAGSSLTVGHWVPPGETVVVHDFAIPGMVYVGSRLRRVSGHGTEPALINPTLRLSNRSVTSETGRYDYGYGYGSSYESLTQSRRRGYLAWLAGGRNESVTDPAYLFLFFYGLERRTLADEDVPEAETATIVAEVRRLIDRYENTGGFGWQAQRLLEHLELRTRIREGFMPDADTLLAQARSFGLPLSLEIALSQIAAEKKPLPADYALAWYLLDPESRPRTAALRCRNEMRSLFSQRYRERIGDGVKLRHVKSRLDITYYPASSSFGRLVHLDRISAANLHRVSRSGFNRVAQVASACTFELDAYSRWIGRRPEHAGRVPAVALLPEPLQAGHPAYAELDETLTVRVPDATPVLLRGAELWHLLGLNARPGKAEASLLMDCVERQGVAVEPDVRNGGALPSNEDFVALARFGDAGQQTAPEKSTAPTLATLVAIAVGRDASAATAPRRAQEIGERAGARLPLRNPAERGHFLARLCLLLATPGKDRLPRQGAEALLPEEKSDLATLLVTLAAEQGSITAERVADLIKIAALLSKDEAFVYSTLHALGHDEGRGRRRGDDLVLVHAGETARGAAIPPPPAEGDVVDMRLVRRKIEDTHRVASVLADIFTDEDEEPSGTSSPVPEKEPEAPASPGAGETVAGLDRRHSALLRKLAERDTWSAAEFAALARDAGLMPAGALETINEAAFETVGEPALDGDDPIRVDAAVVGEMLG